MLDFKSAPKSVMGKHPSIRWLFTFKSSLKPLNRFQPNLPEMFIGWSSTRFVILVLIWNPTWNPLFDNLQCISITWREKTRGSG
jgi:hypothetical protein